MLHDPAAGATAHAPAPPPDHPDTPTAPHNAWRHALRLVAATEQYVAQLRGRLGRSANEMSALLLLHDHGPCTMTELSVRTRISRPALTAMVDRLGDDGWIERRQDEGDRRRVIVSTTDQFERELVRCTRAWRQRLQNHASSSGEDWEVALGHVDALRALAERSALELRESGGD